MKPSCDCLLEFAQEAATRARTAEHYKSATKTFAIGILVLAALYAITHVR